MVKNPPSSTGDAGDSGVVPLLGRFPGGGNGNPSSIFAWESPWTEEPGECSPCDCREPDMTDD